MPTAPRVPTTGARRIAQLASGFAATALACATVPPSPPATAGTDGGLDRSQVDAVVRAHMPALDACYDDARRRSPTLEGRLEITWTVNPDGGVAGAQVSWTSLNDIGIETCMVLAIQRWTFPRAAEATTVTYPFAFRPRPGRLNRRFR